MNKNPLIMMLAGAMVASHAQEVPMSRSIEDLIAKQDQVILENQGNDIFKALDKVGASYAQSTVAVISGNRHVASGIIVAPNIVMTKYSDVVRWRSPLAVLDCNDRVHDMGVLASSVENDVLFLSVAELNLPPIDMANDAKVEEGSMVFLEAPGGHVTDFGVISVNQRSLRDEDRAFIGIGEDSRWKGKGLKIHVVPNSPAHRAGLMNGDVILTINGKAIDGLLSLNTSLNQVNPGDKVNFLVERQGKEYESQVVADRRMSLPKFPQKRLEQMNAMGNALSPRRDNFPMVYQSDMTLKPERAGSPVIDLNGKFVGMALSRAGRTETYILPAWVVKELTQSVLNGMRQKTETPPEQDQIPNGFE